MSRIQQVNNIVPNPLLGTFLFDRLGRANANSNFEKDVLGLLKFAVKELQKAGMQIDETVLIDTKKQTDDVIAALMRVTQRSEKIIKDALVLSVEAFEQLPEVDPIDPRDLEDHSTKHIPRGRKMLDSPNKAKEFF